MSSGEMNGFEIQKTLLTTKDRTLQVIKDKSKQSTYLLETLCFSSPDDAEKVLKQKKEWQNSLSLNYHPSFFNVLKIEKKDSNVQITFEGYEGQHLPHYLKEYFKGYSAEESFAIELTFHLAEMVRSILSSSTRGFSMRKIRMEDIFISDKGRIRVLPHFMESVDEELPTKMLEGFAELLFVMLTPDAPVREKLLKARESNREISEETETIIRRCILSADEGGFGNILSLRQALYKELKPMKKPLKDGYMHDFISKKLDIDYEKNLDEAVIQEENYQKRMKRFDFGRDYNFIMNLFRDAHKQFNWRRLWPLIVFPYLLLLIPFALYINYTNNGINIAPLILGILITFPVYVSFFILVFHTYRRPRD